MRNNNIFEKEIIINKKGKFNGRHQRYDVIINKKKPIEYNEKGCFNFSAAVIGYCFMPKKKRPAKKAAAGFAVDGKFIEMFCDCSNNFEAKKIRQLIIDRNKS